MVNLIRHSAGSAAATLLVVFAVTLSGCGGRHDSLVGSGAIPYDPGTTSGLTPLAEPSARPGDWPTYGFDSARSGYNPNETILAAATVRSQGLRQLWRFNAGGVVDAQPVVAGGVTVGSKSVDLVFFGDEQGDFYALDAANGNVVWRKKLHVQSVNDCDDMPGGVFGVTGAAVVERSTGRVYVADGAGYVYAFDLATGAAATGFASGVPAQPDQNEHIYGALTLDTARHTLYAGTAARCDNEPFHGQIVAIDTVSAAVTHAIYLMGSPSGASGGGVWGPGGVSLDPRNTGYVYALTGNGDSIIAPNAYPLTMLKLNPALNPIDGIDPDPSTEDLDFGATPLLVPPSSGCGQYIAVGKSKNGILYAFENVDALNEPGLVQRIRVGTSEFAGNNIGVAAFSAASKLVYVANGSDSSGGPIRHGLLAFAIEPNCTLSALPVWSNVNGPDGGPNDTPPGNPSVAGSVVYYTNGVFGQILAFDAGDGAQLWSAPLGGPSFTAPSVADGKVFVASWGRGAPGAGGGPGNVTAYGLPNSLSGASEFARPRL